MSQPLPPTEFIAPEDSFVQSFSITAVFATAFSLVFFSMSAIVLCSSLYRAVLFFRGALY